MLTLVPPLAFRVIINKVLSPPKGAAPDLRLLYIALVVDVRRARYCQRRNLRSNVPHHVERDRKSSPTAPAALRARAELPLAEFDRWRPGELIARFTSDMQMMGDAVGTSLPQLIVALITFVSSFAAMVYLDWFLRSCCSCWRR